MKPLDTNISSLPSHNEIESWTFQEFQSWVEDHPETEALFKDSFTVPTPQEFFEKVATLPEYRGNVQSFGGSGTLGSSDYFLDKLRGSVASSEACYVSEDVADAHEKAKIAKSKAQATARAERAYKLTPEGALETLKNFELMLYDVSLQHYESLLAPRDNGIRDLNATLFAAYVQGYFGGGGAAQAGANVGGILEYYGDIGAMDRVRLCQSYGDLLHGLKSEQKSALFAYCRKSGLNPRLDNFELAGIDETTQAVLSALIKNQPELLDGLREIETSEPYESAVIPLFEHVRNTVKGEIEKTKAMTDPEELCEILSHYPTEEGKALVYGLIGLDPALVDHADQWLVKPSAETDEAQWQLARFIADENSDRVWVERGTLGVQIFLTFVIGAIVTHLTAGAAAPLVIAEAGEILAAANAVRVANASRRAYAFFEVAGSPAFQAGTATAIIGGTASMAWEVSDIDQRLATAEALAYSDTFGLGVGSRAYVESIKTEEKYAVVTGIANMIPGVGTAGILVKGNVLGKLALEFLKAGGEGLAGSAADGRIFDFEYNDERRRLEGNDTPYTAGDAVCGFLMSGFMSAAMGGGMSGATGAAMRFKLKIDVSGGAGKTDYTIRFDDSGETMKVKPIDFDEDSKTFTFETPDGRRGTGILSAKDVQLIKMDEGEARAAKRVDGVDEAHEISAAATEKTTSAKQEIPAQPPPRDPNKPLVPVKRNLNPGSILPINENLSAKVNASSKTMAVMDVILSGDQFLVIAPRRELSRNSLPRYRLSYDPQQRDWVLSKFFDLDENHPDGEGLHDLKRIAAGQEVDVMIGDHKARLKLQMPGTTEAGIVIPKTVNSWREIPGFNKPPGVPESVLDAGFAKLKSNPDQEITAFSYFSGGNTEYELRPGRANDTDSTTFGDGANDIGAVDGWFGTAVLGHFQTKDPVPSLEDFYVYIDRAKILARTNPGAEVIMPVWSVDGEGRPTQIVVSFTGHSETDVEIVLLTELISKNVTPEERSRLDAIIDEAETKTQGKPPSEDVAGGKLRQNEGDASGSRIQLAKFDEDLVRSVRGLENGQELYLGPTMDGLDFTPQRTNHRQVRIRKNQKGEYELKNTTKEVVVIEKSNGWKITIYGPDYSGDPKNRNKILFQQPTGEFTIQDGNGVKIADGDQITLGSRLPVVTVFRLKLPADNFTPGQMVSLPGDPLGADGWQYIGEVNGKAKLVKEAADRHLVTRVVLFESLQPEIPAAQNLVQTQPTESARPKPRVIAAKQGEKARPRDDDARFWPLQKLDDKPADPAHTQYHPIDEAVAWKDGAAPSAPLSSEVAAILARLHVDDEVYVRRSAGGPAEDGWKIRAINPQTGRVIVSKIERLHKDGVLGLVEEKLGLTDARVLEMDLSVSEIVLKEDMDAGRLHKKAAADTAFHFVDRRNRAIQEHSHMSETQYRQLSDGPTKQAAVGNCYLVTALKTIRNSEENFKALVMSSIEIGDGFYIVHVPLGDPNGQEITIMESDLGTHANPNFLHRSPHSLLGIDERPVLGPINGPKVMKILEAAYAVLVREEMELKGEIKPGRRHVDRSLIEGGFSVEALQKLLGQDNIKPVTIEGRLKSDGSSYYMLRRRVDQVTKQLLAFNPGRDVLSVNSRHPLKSESRWKIFYNAGENGRFQIFLGHAYAIENVIIDRNPTTGDKFIKEVVVTNPHNNSKRMVMTFDEFLDSFYSISGVQINMQKMFL